MHLRLRLVDFWWTFSKTLKLKKHTIDKKAGNGEIIAVGEAYESKAGCLNGIESVRKNAADADVVESDN